MLSYMYDDLKDKKIVSASTKCDGSMIRFIELPNGRIVAKTKMGFTNAQALAAQEIYNNDSLLKEFVDYTFKKGYAAIFEFISPFNRIVVRYKKNNLVLLQVRDEKTGKYLIINKVDNDVYLEEIKSDKFREVYRSIQIPVALDVRNNRLLDDFLSQAKTLTEVEGWVIRFSDGQFAKVKTKWYLELHRLLTEDLSREDFIIHSTLGASIDDAMAALDKDDPMRDYIADVSSQIISYFNKTLAEVMTHIKAYTGDRKAFAIGHKGHSYFSVLMRGIDATEEDVEKMLKETIVKKTRKLELARSFLVDVGIEHLEKIEEE